MENTMMEMGTGTEMMEMSTGLSTGAKCGISAAAGCAVGVVLTLVFQKIRQNHQIVSGTPANFDKGEFQGDSEEK